jgi:hypothetical protein
MSALYGNSGGTAEIYFALSRYAQGFFMEKEL